MLSHWGWMTHICFGNLTIISPDNGLAPDRRQAIFWTNAGILLIEPLETNFSEISIEIHTFSFKEMHFNMSSAKWRPFCLGLNVLKRNKIYQNLNWGYLVWQLSSPLQSDLAGIESCKWREFRQMPGKSDSSPSQSCHGNRQMKQMR